MELINHPPLNMSYDLLINMLSNYSVEYILKLSLIN